jgi:hypothetical protein
MHEAESEKYPEERPDEFWRRVYWAVIAVTIVVITGLWAFTKYFSS